MRTRVRPFGVHYAERLQFGDQLTRVRARGRTFLRIECLREKGCDLVDGVWTLQEEIEDRGGRGIQQVRIPGQRLEDNAIFVEIDDAQPFGDRKSLGRRQRTGRFQPD